MIAGQYVVHDGTTYKLTRMTGTTAGYVDGPRHTVYELAPLDSGQLVYLHDPSGDDVELTPACEVCELRPGRGACKARGVHDGPPRVLPPAPRPAPQRGWDPWTWCCPTPQDAARRLCGCGGVRHK